MSIVHMKHLFCNTLFHVIDSGVSGQWTNANTSLTTSLTCDDTMVEGKSVPYISAFQPDSSHGGVSYQITSLIEWGHQRGKFLKL